MNELEKMIFLKKITDNMKNGIVASPKQMFFILKTLGTFNYIEFDQCMTFNYFCNHLSAVFSMDDNEFNEDINEKLKELPIDDKLLLSLEYLANPKDYDFKTTIGFGHFTNSEFGKLFKHSDYIAITPRCSHKLIYDKYVAPFTGVVDVETPLSGMPVFFKKLKEF